jgi:hypothetical protein
VAAIFVVLVGDVKPESTFELPFKELLFLQPAFSQVLSQAYESYLCPHGQPLSYNGSPNHLQTTFTVNPTNSHHVEVQQQLPVFSSHPTLGHSTPASTVSNPMIPMNTHLNPMINNQHSNIQIPHAASVGNFGKFLSSKGHNSHKIQAIKISW